MGAASGWLLIQMRSGSIKSKSDEVVTLTLYRSLLITEIETAGHAGVEHTVGSARNAQAQFTVVGVLVVVTPDR